MVGNLSSSFCDIELYFRDNGKGKKCRMSIESGRGMLFRLMAFYDDR